MNDLEQIKEILFGNEKKALNALVRRLETPESRTADVADVLPDAVNRSYQQDERLGRALSKPMESTLADAIRREPKKFADALYPVIGPAIRKAIAEALKSMMDRINTAIDTRFSPSTRFAAWRAGVPWVELALRDSLVFRVDEVYLIAPTSGLLINHLHHRDVVGKDEDAVSAMLTAIQDFVSDSFTHGVGSGLGSVELGEYTVWISQGPHAMLACVMRGVPPVELKEEIAAVNERVHLRHGQELREFDGDAGSVSSLDIELEELLQTQTKEPGKKKKGWFFPFLGVMFVALMIWLGYLYIVGQSVDRKMKKFDALVNQTPGMLTTSTIRDGRQINVRGIRDPLAAEPRDLATSVGIRPENLTLNFRPYQSLESPIVEQRARQILAPPQEVTLQMRGQTLAASGNASAQWRNKLLSLAPAIAGIDSVDTSALRGDDESLAAQIKALLQPPPSANISVTQGVAIFSGLAPKAWHQKIAGLQQKIPGIVDMNTGNLKITELERINQVATAINKQAIYYSAGVQIVPDQDVAMLETAKLIREYHQLATALGRRTEIRVVGFADGTGPEDLNRIQMARRANDYRDRLVNLGVDPSLLSVDTSGTSSGIDINPQLRRAELQLSTIQ